MTQEALVTNEATKPPARTALRAWRQPAQMLSFAYLATSAVGLWSSYWFYQPFGVNILQFMEVTDFLAAGLRDPVYFFIVFGAVVAGWVMMWPERWALRNPERVKRLMRHWWWRWIIAPHWHERVRDKIGVIPAEAWLFVGIVWMSVWVLFGYVSGHAKEIIKGGGRVVKLSAEADVREGMCAAPRLIGTTSLYVFLYCGESRTVEVVPIESVGRLTLSVEAPKSSSTEPPKEAAP